MTLTEVAEVMAWVAVPGVVVGLLVAFWGGLR